MKKIKCRSCNSTNLRAYNRRSFEDILYLKDNKWYFQSPKINHIYYNSRDFYLANCLDCHESFEIKKPFSEIYKPELNNFKEITLDLDGTLLDSNNEVFFKWDNHDFTVKYPPFTYKMKKRPYLKEFLDFINKKYDKINIFTAAEPEYAEQIVKEIFPNTNLGFFKTVKDCINKRSIKFDRESIKKINNQLIIEDRPHVIEGNNTVIPISQYVFRDLEEKDNDQELLNLIDFIQNYKDDNKRITLPKKLKTTISLFLRHHSLPEVELSLDEIQKLTKEIKIINEETLKRYPVMTKLYDPYFEIKEDKCKISIVDIDYNEYLRIVKILKIKKYLDKDIYSELINRK